MRQKELMNLLSQMSEAEKINQLLQVSGNFYLEDTILTGPLQEKGFTEESISLAGSVIGVSDPAKIMEIQKAYMEKHPHHIPLLFMCDVINGMHTVFPIPLAQGAAFDPELSRACAEASAREASASGIHVTFSPMVDLVRDSRWGRVMESTGEDKYLNGLYAKAMVEGYQGENLSDENRMAACVKHFAGYGAAEAGRDYNTVELTEQTLRDSYLPSYQAGIDAGSALVMTSFNTVNGVPATGNRWLMQQVLREEMGFDGVLISDWTAIEELIAHGYCENRREAARRAMEAGVDIDMMSGIYATELPGLLSDGTVTREQLDQAVLRVLTLKNKLGLFENPYKDADVLKAKQTALCQAHRDLARKAAAETCVLLKNEGVLPLSQSREIAWIGPYVKEKNLSGAWSMFGNSQDTVSLEEAAREVFPGDSYVEGCPVLENSDELIGVPGVKAWSCLKLQQEQEAALEAAREADVVVMALGEHRYQSGEAACRTRIQLPQVQLALLRKVAALGKPVVTLIFGGRPLELGEVSELSDAVMQVWLPGTEGGHGIVDLLCGIREPVGRLPMSFPRNVGQLPLHYDAFTTGRPQFSKEGEIKYYSQYLDCPNEALYPFGFGLGYTEFTYEPVRLSCDTMKKGETITASVQIRNTGRQRGTEVVQLYIQDLFGSSVRPQRELKGFQRVTLNPGQEQTVSFQIEETMLRFYTERKCYESEPGSFRVWIGSSSAEKNHACFRLTEK